MITQDMIARSLELSVDLFNGIEVLQGMLLGDRIALVLEVTKFDKEIDLLVIHQGDTLGHLGQRFSILARPSRVGVGIMCIRHNSERQVRFAVGSVGMSKGHGGVGHAAVLGDLGFFDVELLKSFNKTGSPFGMHLDAGKVPGVDASTGSLGHGLGIALGMAIGARHQGKPWHTYCVCSDGELCEGTIWEGAMSGNQFKVTNLTVLIDRNMLMIDGRTEDIMSLEPLDKRWEAFAGWLRAEWVRRTT